MLERAVRLDPEFAAARAELANAYVNEASFAPPRDVATAKASQMAAARAAPLVNPALDRDSGDSVAQLVLKGEGSLAFTSLANFNSLAPEVQVQLRILDESLPMTGRVYLLNAPSVTSAMIAKEAAYGRRELMTVAPTWC